MNRWLICLIAVAALSGCDSKPSPVATTKPAAGQSDQLPEMRCDLSVIAPLLPRQPTHVAVTPSSNIYYIQESAGGGDAVFNINGDGVASVTPLSSPSILLAMKSKGSGNIKSIAAGADGNIYFFFSGENKSETLACFGRYEPSAGKIRLLADEDALASATGMGVSLALARGQVVASGNSIWLWIHHSDASALFLIHPGAIGETGAMTMPAPVIPRSGDGTLLMTRDYEAAGGPDDSILFLDITTAALWKIDVTGTADVLQTLVGLPKSLSAPAINRSGDIVMFATPSEPIAPTVQQRIAPVQLDTNYPALLIQHQSTLSAIGRDDIHAAPEIPLSALKFDRLIYDRGRDNWIAYDPASGQLIRLALAAK